MNVEKDPFPNKGHGADDNIIINNNAMLLTLGNPIATTSPTTTGNVFNTKKMSTNINKKTTDTFERPPKSTIPSYELLDVMQSPVAPIMWLEQARKLDSYVFRLPIKRLGCPMVVLVGDAAVARRIWNDPPGVRTPDPTPSPGACMEITNYKTDNGGNPSNRYAGRPVQTILNPLVGTGLTNWIEDTIHPLLAEYNPITDGNEPRALDADEDMRHLALSILGEAAFDYRLDYQERKILMDKPPPKNEDLFRKKPPRNRPPATPILSIQRRSWKTTMARMELCGKMVHQYREKYPNFQDQDNPRTVLDLFLADPCYKTEKELLADVLAFIDTCHQNVATTLGFTLLELARSRSRKHQGKLRSQLVDIQKRYKEKKEAGKDCGDHPNWFGSTRLRNAIWEGMRLYPAQAIGTGGKILEKDVLVKNMKIPKGSLAVMSLFVMQRDRNVFKDNADVFQPDRWDIEAAFGEHNQRQAMVPLNQGPRDSTAQAMANAIVWHVLPRLLIDYEFNLEDEGRVKFVGALKPHKTRISVRLHEPDLDSHVAALL